MDERLKGRLTQNSLNRYVTSIAMDCSRDSCKYHVNQTQKGNSLPIFDDSQVILPTENQL